MFALAVAVGLTPELLPVIVNVNFARNARLLASQGLIIKDLASVHAFGSMDTLCLEKVEALISGDPLKREVKSTITALSTAGVSVKILTGDDAAPAIAAARVAGIANTDHPLTGSKIRGMNDEALAAELDECSVCAELSPTDKARIIRVLRLTGDHVVGFLGEGPNDAGALRAADIGLAPEGGAALARECADVIMTTHDLRTLLEGVEAGRTALGNILKYIKITASSNFGNAFSVVLASVVLPFLPMRAVQLVAQNLLYDLSQIFLPWDRVDNSAKEKPRSWSADSIGRFMLIFGPLSSIFDVLTFAFLWYVIGANSVAEQAVFQTGWFMVGLATQLTIVHVLRTETVPFFGNRAIAPLGIATLIALIVGLTLPFSPVAQWFGFEPMPWIYFGWILFTVAGYALAAQLTKTVYRRVYGQWM